jgi:hypothetical protein
MFRQSRLAKASEEPCGVLCILAMHEASCRAIDCIVGSRRSTSETSSRASRLGPKRMGSRQPDMSASAMQGDPPTVAGLLGVYRCLIGRHR